LLETLVMAHRYLYYVECSPVLSDNEYDKLERLAKCALPPESVVHKPGSDLLRDYLPGHIRCADEMRSLNSKTWFPMLLKAASEAYDAVLLQGSQIVGNCGICYGSIMQRESQIDDDAGSYHAMCFVTRRAETAENALADLERVQLSGGTVSFKIDQLAIGMQKLQKELEQLKDGIRQIDGRSIES